jgi:hypothetical protein
VHQRISAANPSEARRAARRLIGGLEDREHVSIEGMQMSGWVALWRTCHAFVQGNPVRIAFPDGGCLDEQDALIVNMFSLIEAEWAKEVEDMMQRGQ